MEIEAISVSVNQQILTVDKMHPIIDDTANIYIASFHFDAEWDGFARAVILQNGQEFAFALLDHDNRCQIPARVINSGTLYIGIQGNKDGKVITTKEADGVKISNSGGIINLVPEPFEQSEYQRLMDRLAAVQTYVEDKTNIIERLSEEVGNNKTVAVQAAERAKEQADISTYMAELAKQEAANGGYMFFSIEDGRLIYTKTDKVEIDFTLEEGRLMLNA